MANVGITEPFAEFSNYLVITETLQQADSDTLEAFPTSQYSVIRAIVVCGWINTFEKRPIYKLSTYTQRLKQLGFSLDTFEDAEPAVFRWMMIDYLVFENSRAVLEGLRSTLPMLLSLGADVNSRWRGYPPLIWLFRKNNRGIDTDDFESRTTNVTDIAVALLENGVDLLALSDEGFSVFDVAEHNGLNSQLVQALQRTGYNFGKVRYKTLLAQWIFFNPGVSLAKSTAVDRSQSKAGVVSRRAIAGDRLEE